MKIKNKKINLKERYSHSLITVGDLSEFPDSHGFFLYVVLSEESRLTSHQLLDGCWDNKIIDVVIGRSWLPLFGRNDLQRTQRWRQMRTQQARLQVCKPSSKLAIHLTRK